MYTHFTIVQFRINFSPSFSLRTSLLLCFSISLNTDNLNTFSSHCRFLPSLSPSLCEVHPLASGGEITSLLPRPPLQLHSSRLIWIINSHCVSPSPSQQLGDTAPLQLREMPVSSALISPQTYSINSMWNWKERNYRILYETRQYSSDSFHLKVCIISRSNVKAIRDQWPEVLLKISVTSSSVRYGINICHAFRKHNTHSWILINALTRLLSFVEFDKFNWASALHMES